MRFELKQWGIFWARQEEGTGYSSKSNVQAIKEACQVGCASSSDLHLFSHRSDSIYVPAHIDEIGRALERLNPRCIIALRQRYVTKGLVFYFEDNKAFLFWVGKAERELL